MSVITPEDGHTRRINGQDVAIIFTSDGEVQILTPDVPDTTVVRPYGLVAGALYALIQEQNPVLVGIVREKMAELDQQMRELYEQEHGIKSPPSSPKKDSWPGDPISVLDKQLRLAMSGRKEDDKWEN